MDARDRRRDPTSGPVDTAEWLAELCASASLQLRRQRSRSSASGGGSWRQQRQPNSAQHDDLDAEALSSGVLDAFSALHDSLASLLGDPDSVREVVERGGELFRLNRGVVAEACRRRREEGEGPAYNHHGTGYDNGQSSPGRRDEPTWTSRNATAEGGVSSVTSAGSGSLLDRRMQRKLEEDTSFHSRSTRQAGRSSDDDFSHDSYSNLSRPGAVSVASNGSGRLLDQRMQRKLEQEASRDTGSASASRHSVEPIREHPDGYFPSLVRDDLTDVGTVRTNDAQTVATNYGGSTVASNMSKRTIGSESSWCGATISTKGSLLQGGATIIPTRRNFGYIEEEEELVDSGDDESDDNGKERFHSAQIGVSRAQSSGVQRKSDDDMARRIEEVRAALGDYDSTDDEIRNMLKENDRASEIMSLSLTSLDDAEPSHAASSEPARVAERSAQGGGRIWDECIKPVLSGPSPSAFDHSGFLDSSPTSMPESVDLPIRQVAARERIHSILTSRLGRDLEETVGGSSEYDRVSAALDDVERWSRSFPTLDEIRRSPSDLQAKVLASCGTRDVADGILQFIVEANRRNGVGGSEKSVEAAVGMLRSMCGSYHTKMELLGGDGTSDMRKAENVVDTIVAQMTLYKSVRILEDGCAILGEAAEVVCHRGGLGVLVDAAGSQNGLLASAALRALSAVVSGATSSDLLSVRACEAVVGAMARHPGDVAVQVWGANATWLMSAIDDVLKESFVGLGGADLIARAMDRFVACETMQEKGIGAVWSLAVPVGTKRRVGSAAVGSVINGLAAFPSSCQVVANGLGCLKCFSIDSGTGWFDEAIELVYSCLWLHLNNPSLSQVGLAALCNITIKLESNEVSRISEDELEIVLQVMLAHRNIRVVQSNAIQALKNFTFSQSNLEVLGKDEHLVDTVLAARSVHRQGFQGRDEELLMSLPPWQRKTTSGICSNRTGHLDDSSLGKSRSNFSLPSSAAAARSRPGAVAVPSSEESSVKKGNNTSLQLSYNSELGSAYSHSGDESRPGAVMGNPSLLQDKILHFGGSRDVADRIMQFIAVEADPRNGADGSKYSVEVAVGMLRSMCGAYHTKMELLGGDGTGDMCQAKKVVKTIVAQMTLYPNNDRIVEDSCAILRESAEFDLLRRTVCRCGGLDQLADVAGSQNGLLASAALRALSAVVSGATSSDLLSSRACEAVVGAMELHPDDVAVQVWGANATWSLSAVDDVEKVDDVLKELLVGLGCADLIARAMDRFVACETMQEKGIGAVWSLARPAKTKRRVGSAAVGSVINGLAAFPGSCQVVKFGLGCLKCFSIDSGTGWFDEAIELVYSCLWLHLNNPALSQMGLAALCNITIKREYKEVLRISEDELEIVLQVMLTHQNTRLVQSIAIQALQNLTFSQSNLELFGRDEHLVNAVLAARFFHPEGFERRDEELLMSLPSWQQKTASTSCSNRTSPWDDLDDLDDRVRSKIDENNSLGKSWSDSPRPSSAAPRPGAVPMSPGEDTPLDRHIQKKEGENALRASENSELGSGTSHSTDESRLGAVPFATGKNNMLDKRMKKKSEKESVTSQSGSQGNTLASSSQGNRLLDERRAKKLEKEESSCTGTSQQPPPPSMPSSTPGAKLVPNNSALGRRVQAKQQKGYS